MAERRQGRHSRQALVGAACAGGLALGLGAGAWAGHATAPAAPAPAGGGPPTCAPSDDLARRLRLPDVLAALDRARVGMRARLRHANTVAGQARLARGLARAHLAAAASLRPVAGSAGAALVA